MEYEWDEAKRLDNREKHRGVDFTDMEGFDWETALIEPSPRHDEARSVALGHIGARLYHVVFVERGDVIRIISLRKANPRERRQYGNPN